MTDFSTFLIFLSTPSARRATERHNFQIVRIGISIHALREEGDCRRVAAGTQAVLFLSTPSARRATNDDADDLPF